MRPLIMIGGREGLGTAVGEALGFAIAVDVGLAGEDGAGSSPDIWPHHRQVIPQTATPDRKKVLVILAAFQVITMQISALNLEQSL
jgi:hypothetical protein